MSAYRFDQLPVSPFVRLRELLDGVRPGDEPIDLSIGAPKHPFPPFIMEALNADAENFGRYPPIQGTDELQAAIAGWLKRRYGAQDAGIAPLNGTREGLYYIAPFLTPGRKDAVVLLPNPYYPVYAAAALAADAEPHYLPALKENGYLPDLDTIPQEALERASCMYLCSPSNPQGAAASYEYLEYAVGLARKHDFTLISDECYGEIYTKTPPAGALEAGMKTGSFKNIIAFHSLSKRSNLPGLRSGFCAGDEVLVKKFIAFRNVAGPQMPLPLQAAAAAAWSDDEHVDENRRLYEQKFSLADELLAGRFDYKRPDGGFFLWLDVSACGGGENAAGKLWREAGVKTIPGGYLGVDGPGGNPGDDYIRVALVDSPQMTRDALQRIVEVLGE